jgi:RHS repeat-associated protein
VLAFTYDALGRRLSKTFRGKTTRWIWDGNVPLHEWIELTDEALARDGEPLRNSFEREVAQAKRKAHLSRRTAQGPPELVYPSATSSDDAGPASLRDGTADAEPLVLEGTADAPITWLFEPDSFAPLGKLVADERHSVVTDHLGTPRAMFDAHGQETWAADIDTYGQPQNLRGARRACPFRFPGQYEDEETGLYYNRFRYYDPEAGGYVSQDPIGLAGGSRPYGYVRDPLIVTDRLGLSGSCNARDTDGTPISRKNARRLLLDRGLTPKQASDIVNSFEGQIFAREGTIGEVFVITEAKPGAASAVFVTRDFAGATPNDRVRRLALPPTNSAEFEGLVELSRDQTLLEGRVAAQPQWGADKTGGGWQTVTDGGRYTGAVRRLI